MSADSLSFAFECSNIAEPVCKEFEWTVRMCHSALEKLAKGGGMPSRIEVILADDLKGQVLARTRDHPAYPKDFDPERPMGRVGAKNLAQDDDWNHVVIVFSANEWSSANRSERDQLLSLGLVGHELAHPLLARLRIASGAELGVIYPSILPGEMARSMTRRLADEYRADQIADTIVGVLCTKTSEGKSSPAHIWDVEGASYFEALRALFTNSMDTMAGSVNAYRIHQRSLDEMWRETVRATEHLLTMLVHARAHADIVGLDVPLIMSPELRDLPFVKLYLAETVPPLFEALRSWPLIMSPAEWKTMEANIVPIGERVIRDIWRRLGLTFEETTSRESYRINVAAPLL
jgi:hypothetical protein